MSIPAWISRSHLWVLTTVIALSFAVLPSSVFADSHDSNQPSWTGSDALQKSPDDGWKTRIFTGFEFQGDTDLEDSPADFKYWMISGGVQSSKNLGDSVTIALKGDYRAIGYNFSGVRGSKLNPPLPGTFNPWETVHVVRLNPLLTLHINETWSLIGGPIIEFSGEESADFSDSVRGGGLVGVGFKRERFYMALGVLATTELEKDARINPFILFDWKISDGFSLGLKADTSRGGELRLDYAFSKHFKLGVGLGARNELFRLNDDLGQSGSGRRSEGVGEESSRIVKVTGVYQINKLIAIEGYGGLTLNGEFRLEDENGGRIAQADYDNSGFGGVNVRFSF